VLRETQDNEEIIERVAALDIGKAELVCCARVPDESRSGRRLQEVETYSTMTRSLLVMADRLRQLGVTRVVMEATSDYVKPPFYVLEAHGFETWLVNAKDVKHLPGRPKSDKLDAAWLCKVAERQMIRPSFVPPPQIRWLRELTRYRVDLVEARTAEKQRVEKLLEDALLTELAERSWSFDRWFVAFADTVPSREWNSGCAAGSVVVGRGPVWGGPGDR
jgi:transposase